MNTSDRGRALSALVLVTILWGSTFVVIHAGVEGTSPTFLIALRFLVAAMSLVLASPSSLRPAILMIPVALPLSASALGAFLLQARGLTETSPSRSAFLTALSVLLVPAIVYLRDRQKPGRLVSGAALLALLGVWVLFHPLGSEWRRGDTETIAGAALFAFYVVELGRLSRLRDGLQLVLSQCVTIGALAALLAPMIDPAPMVGTSIADLAGIAWLGLVCTGVVFLLMTWGQARVEPARAAILYTLEPVFAAVLSVMVGREQGTVALLIGGGLVLAGTVVASLPDDL